MSYTATFDASHKVKASGAHSTNFARHIARDADQAAGFSFAQRNENIDPARTSMNITMVNDGRGGWRAPVVTQDDHGKDRPPSAELTDHVDARLATVKRKIKADAVALRPMVLQLDPQWFAEHNPEWRENGLTTEAEEYIAAQLDWANTEFGHENLPGYSVHMDETNPQLQLLFTPVTQDGRLSQKDYFKGPGDLQRQHKAHRQALANAGYDVEFKVTKRSKEHLSSAEFAQRADRVRARHERILNDDIKLDQWDEKLRDLRDTLADRADLLDEREGVLDHREADMPALRRRAVEAGKKEGRAEGYDEGRAAAKTRADKVMEVFTAQLRVTAPQVVDDFLDRKDSRGRSYRPIFERYVDQRLEQFAVEHDVAGRLELEVGDREVFIDDGGELLAEEVIRKQRQRAIGD